MKVRLRDGCGVTIGDSQVTVIEESENFYLCEDPSQFGRVICLQKTYWEPVPEKAWRDVTAECERDGESIYHRRPDGVRRVVTGPGCSLFMGYRFSKVQLRDLYYENKYDAIIIEHLE